MPGAVCDTGHRFALSVAGVYRIREDGVCFAGRLGADHFHGAVVLACQQGAAFEDPLPGCQLHAEHVRRRVAVGDQVVEAYAAEVFVESAH